MSEKMNATNFKRKTTETMKTDNQDMTSIDSVECHVKWTDGTVIPVGRWRRPINRVVMTS